MVFGDTHLLGFTQDPLGVHLVPLLLNVPLLILQSMAIARSLSSFPFPGVSVAQRQARFRELFRDDFDLPGIGRFVLGRYWRVATPQEQQDFLGLFQEYLVRAYSARLGTYGGEPFRVTGVHPNGEETIVNSEIIRPNSSPIAVDWYLIGRGPYKITDVYVGGVSMKVTQRDEFASVIQRNGGRVEALITQLRQKLAVAG